MSTPYKSCFACTQLPEGALQQVLDPDLDKITFLSKLKAVVPDLIEREVMELCPNCVKNLRIAYNFKETVILAQKQFWSLNWCKTEAFNICKEEDGGAAPRSKEAFCKEEAAVLSSDESEASEPTAQAQRRRPPKPKDEAPKTCDLCGSRFAKKWQLTKHLQRVHSQERKFGCLQCGKEFKQAFHLKEHQTSHSGEKNFSCFVCGKTFQRQSSQKRHSKSHDAPPGQKTKRTPFLCTICGKSFPFSNGVQRHMRVHLGIKKFECKLCTRKFTQSTHLHVHMRTHTGEKPYICHVCGEKFSLKACLIRHVANRHETDVEASLLYLDRDESFFKVF